MGYWKREYTERKAVKPLFKPEPKATAPSESREDEQTDREQADSEQVTPPRGRGDHPPTHAQANGESPPPAEAPEESPPPSTGSRKASVP